MSETKQLLQTIHDAFSDVARIPDEELFGPAQDYLWVEKLLSGTEPWQELPASAIACESYALTAVTPAGFRFFLPAYMCWVVSNADSNSNTVAYTIYALDISGRKSETKQMMFERFAALTDEQGKAVRYFLEWAAERPNFVDVPAANSALTSYWRRY